MRYSFFSLILLCLLLSCKDADTATTYDNAVEIPEDFVEFYKKFHADTTYQLEHIQFPLEGVPALDPNEDDGGFSYWWERDGWKFHKPFNDMDGTFTRTFHNFEGIITEHIADNTGQFTMLRRYTKTDGEWRLIFYKQLGRNRLK